MASLRMYAEYGGKRKQSDHGKYNEENRFFHFSHDLASCAAVLSVPVPHIKLCRRQNARSTITYYYIPIFAISQ